MNKAAAYHEKAVQLKKEMWSLEERADKLKKRTMRLAERKRRHDERAHEKEQALEAVDISSSAGRAMPAPSVPSQKGSSTSVVVPVE